MWALSPSESSVGARHTRGFTIVELLVVIVVVGILAAITTVAYGSVQGKTQQAKIKNDINTLKQAITIARNNKQMTLYNLMNSAGVPNANWTSGSCGAKATGTNLATLPKTDQCWTDYYAALDSISAAGGGDGLHNLVDPWGRPYALDANENEGGVAANCGQDAISVYPLPFVNAGATTNWSPVLNSGYGGCTNNTAFQNTNLNLVLL